MAGLPCIPLSETLKSSPGTNGPNGKQFDRGVHKDKHCSKSKNEPRPEISNNVVGATSKASDQPVHTRSLIRAIASRLNIL